MPDPDSSAARRPVAVPIIAGISIALGLFFLLTYGLAGYLFLKSSAMQSGQEFNPGAFLGWSVSVPVYWTLVFLVPLVLVIDGVFLLKGHNWARMLAVFWWTFSFLSLIYTYGLSIMTGIQAAFCLLVIFFLNTRAAVIFFKGDKTG
jgi:hypothetical protein